MIRSVTYDPPQNRWEPTSIGSFRGVSALITPPLNIGQNACVTVEFDSLLPPGSDMAFSWRTTSRSAQDILRFQAGGRQRQIQSTHQWQTEYIDLGRFQTTVSWCYSKNSADERQTARGWLDSLLLVTPADRYNIQIAATSTPILIAAPADTFQYSVEVRAESPLLPPPPDWVLIVSGIDNVIGTDSTYALVFNNEVAEAEVFSTPANPYLPSTVLLALADRPSFLGATATSISYALPVRELGMLQILAAAEATQITPDALLEIAIAVSATDNLGRPFNPTGLALMVSDSGNANVSQSTYTLTFAGGTARTTVTVGLDTQGTAGRIEVSVSRGDIESTVRVTLNPAPMQLAALSIVAPEEVTQSTADAAIEIAVTVIADDNYGNPFDPTGLTLTVAGTDNADLTQTTYALTFAGGTARTTVTVELTTQGTFGRIEVSVSSGNITDSAAVVLIPSGSSRLLTQLSVTAPAAVTQTAADAAIDIAVTVIARDNFNLPFDPTGLALMVDNIDNADLTQSTYALTFAGGTARTTVTVRLTTQGIPGRIEVSVSSGNITDSATVVLIPFGSRQMLTQLSVTAPEAVTQTAPDAAIDIAVTVIARDNFNLPFDPTGLALMVEGADNADVPQSTYALTFAGGTARTTVTVGLDTQGTAGRIEVSVSSGNITDSAAVVLIPSGSRQMLTQLSVTAPAAVTQTAPGAAIDVAVTVIARDNFNLPFDPTGLTLMVENPRNANVSQSTYALTFTGGTARTTVTVGLDTQGIAGRIEMSVSSGSITDSAAVVLIPFGSRQMLTQLSVSAPEAVTQTAAGAAIDVAVTVIALDNFNLPFDPTGLALMVKGTDNADLTQSTYALTFTEGTARTTVTVRLTTQGIPGRIEVSVSSGSITDSAAVVLIPSGSRQMLTQLSVTAPAAVTQTAADAAIDVAVTVIARDNFNLPFDPPGLTLMVENPRNANVSQSTYALTFTGGTARTTVTVRLTTQGIPGRIEVSVSSGSITDSAAVVLIPFGSRQMLTQLSVSAPAAVTQTAADAAIDVAVTVIARDNFNLPFDPTGLALMVEGADNADVPQSTYALTFAGGTARTTVTVELAAQGTFGRIEVSVSRGNITDSATVVLIPFGSRQMLTQLSVSAPAAVTQTAADAAIDVAVTVIALDNFNLPFDPPGLTLMVDNIDNADLTQTTYALTFTEGTARTTVTVELAAQGTFGRIEVSVSSGNITDSATVVLIPFGSRQMLTQLSVTAPAAVTQTAPGAAIDVAVTVIARDNFNLPFDPPGLTLMVSDSGNANVSQSTYALTFAGGTARTTVTVGLDTQGIAGRIEVSVSSGSITASAAVVLIPSGSRQMLTQLSVTAPAAVTQTAADAAIDVAVTVIARDNFNLPFDPPGLTLMVEGADNADLTQTTYALTFTEGTARTTVTVGLTAQGIPGRIEVSVSSGSITASAAVVLIPSGSRQMLTQLSVTAPAAVTQTAADAAIDVAVTVIALDNFNLPFDPAGLTLMVKGTDNARDNFNLPFDPAGLILMVDNIDNADLTQSTYALTFAGGTARTTVTVGLDTQGIPGRIEVSVSSGSITDSAAVVLIPSGSRQMLTQLSVTAPEAVTQTAPDAAIDIAVTVIARDNFNLPFDPPGLALMVEGADNADVPQSTYALTFTGGTARTTVTVELTAQGTAGRIEVSVSSGNITASAAVVLIPSGSRQMLTQLSVTAPAAVTQTAPGAAIDIAVTVITRDNFNLPFDPTGLTLTVAGADNANVPQSTYALTFTGGAARTTVTVELAAQGTFGRIEVSVSSGSITDSAAVVLIPSGSRQMLTQLSVTAPAAVTQTAANAAIDIAVTVIARDNFNLPIDPANLTLMVEGADNADVPQSTYALTFAEGTARTTVTVELAAQGTFGRIEVSVSSGSITDSAAVVLIPFGSRQMLTQLSVTAPESVTQTAPGAAIDIAVTVIALDNFNLPFDPADLTLMVAGTDNADLTQSTYALTFTGGTARTTVTVELDTQGIPGRIEVSVSSGNITDSAAVVLIPSGSRQMLTQLSVTAPEAVTQTAADAAIDVAVTVIARDNFNLPFDPPGLTLMVDNIDNAYLTQSTYALTFAGGTARTTVTVRLTTQGIAGRIEVSVSSGNITASAAVVLIPSGSRQMLTQLSVSAPAAVTQTAPGAAIDVAVTVIAGDNFNLPIDPADLTLTVAGTDNANVSQTTYALTFTEGTARTTVTVGLTAQGTAGRIEVSVSSGSITDSAAVVLIPFGSRQMLTQLSVTAPAAVTQTAADAAIDIAVTVIALDNFNLPFDPANLTLMVAGTDNADLTQSTYALTFTEGTARTTVTVGLTTQGIPGHIEVSVSSGSITDSAAVVLIPSGSSQMLTQLSVTAPEAVTQTAPGAAIDVAVTVIAGDNFNLPIDPADLTLTVAGTDNANVSQSTYALTFTGGTARTTVTVRLTTQGIPGRIEVSVSSGNITDSAAVVLIPSGSRQMLTQLSVTAPAAVTQTAPGAAIDVAVTVIAGDNFNLPIDPAGLALMVDNIDNADLTQSTYALTFTGGAARTTVTVRLTTQGIPGRIEVSVSSGTITDSAAVVLIPFGSSRLLTQLSVSAPAAVTQTTPDAAIDIAVTVIARDNFNLPFDPTGLTLMVEGADNADLTQSTYALTFTGGTARTTVTVGLDTQGTAGRIEVSVSSGSITDSAAVVLIPFDSSRLLTQLSVSAPAAVTQTAPDAAIDVAVTVIARDNFNLPFDPTGLTLMVEGTDNARVPQSTYALTFAGGTARTTVTVELAAQGSAGRIEVSVSSGSITDSAAVVLIPSGSRQMLTQLSVSAPAAVTQTAPGAAIDIAVTVITRDNFNLPFDPTGLTLTVAGADNANVPQSTYALTFTGGAARTTVTVELAAQGTFGRIEVSVSSGSITDSAAVVLIPSGSRQMLTQLSVTAPAAVTQTAANAAIDIAVTVIARDNFNLPIDPANLTLMVAGTDNADLTQTTYALTFTEGTARTTVTVGLDTQGIPGRIEVSVSSGNITASAAVVLIPSGSRQMLTQLSVSAPAAVTQTAADAAIDIAVTVIARDNFNLPFDPTGLALMVDNIDNADLTQSTYALTFTEGTARTTVTVGLDTQGIPGRIEVSVSSGNITASAAVVLIPSGSRQMLTQLSVSAPAAVTQTAADAAIDIAVTVIALDNFNLPFDPANLTLMVAGTDNANVSQSTYVLNFTGGTARTTVTVELDTQGIAGRIEVSVSSGSITDSAAVVLIPSGSRQMLTQLSVSAPAAVTQTAAGAAIDVAVTVIALDNFNLPFDPTGLTLMVEGADNADVPQSTYALTFTGGTARTTVTVGLDTQGIPGRIEVSVSSGNITASAAVVLIPFGSRQMLTQLSVTAPAAVTQTAAGAAIDVAVTVIARDNFNLPFDPPGLTLTVAGTDNANVSQSTYALTFTGGTARTTVTVGLTTQGIPGHIEVSVSSGSITDSAAVVLIPFGSRQMLTQLSVSAPAAVTQTAADAAIDIAVTVIALDNFNLPFDPTGLALMVDNIDNADLTQSTYALTFTEGTARTTVTVELADESSFGRIEVSVSSGSITDSATVVLIPSGSSRLLTQLSVSAPAAVTQTAADAAIDVAVTVIARDNFNLPFDPTGLALMVEGADNADVPQSTYALTFAGGTAQTTVTVELDTQGIPGRIEVSVSSGNITASAAVVLIPFGSRQMLTQLSVTAPAAVTQTAAGAAIDVAVTVIARDNFNLPFDPTGLALMVEGADNADVPQSTYALTFAGGTARTTVTVRLATQGIAGRIEVSVSSGNITASAAVVLIPSGSRQMLTQLSVTAPAAVTQTAADAAIDVAVTVIARDNFNLPFDPTGLALMVEGADNADVPQSTYALTFTGGTARTTVTVGLDTQGIAGRIEVSVSSGNITDSATVVLIPFGSRQMLTQLSVTAPAAVTQTAADAAIDVAVTVIARDNFNLPFDPPNLTLMVAGTDNANVSQSTYVLNFTGGTARTTVTVELDTQGIAGRIEVSVSSGNIESTARVTLNPAPRVLVSVNLSAASSNLVQSTANTAVSAELILTALDNYGDPIETGNISLQLSASHGAVVQSSLTMVIEASGTARQMIDIQLQNDLDTTVTVQILRGNLDEAVQLLPDGAIQIEVRALRVLRQLQLSLANPVSQLRQIGPRLPTRINIGLIGLDQYGQPIAFTEVMLTATAEPSTTKVTLNPQRLSSTEPQEAVTVLEVQFPEILDTTVTIAIVDPGSGVTAQDLIIQVLPNRRGLASLNVDDVDTNTTRLDLIIVMRWLADQQRSTESLVFNLPITTANITAAGINNLHQLFNNPGNLGFIDVNRDGRADQLDVRALLRYKSGLRGTELAEQEVAEDIIRLLLGKP